MFSRFITPDLQKVGIDEGRVDPACVDLTEVSAEAVEVKVTERLLHQAEVREGGGAAGHEEEDHERLSPGAHHHHWSSSRHHHHDHITACHECSSLRHAGLMTDWSVSSAPLYKL